MNLFSHGFFLFSALFINSFYAMDETMKYARVVGSPRSDLNNKVVEIEGDLRAIWGVDDVRDVIKIVHNWAIVHYLETNPPATGKVYYGKIDSAGHCFHESWLQKISEDEAKQTLDERNKSTSATVNGTLVVGPAWFVEMMRHDRNKN